MARGGKDPFIVVKNPSASKGGVAETSIKARLSFPTVMKMNVFLYRSALNVKRNFVVVHVRTFNMIATRYGL